VLLAQHGTQGCSVGIAEGEVVDEEVTARRRLLDQVCNLGSDDAAPSGQPERAGRWLRRPVAPARSSPHPRALRAGPG
jgi:hypothetical protein